MDYVSTAIEAARAGGEILRRHFAALPEVRAKQARDLVTEADVESEEAILGLIRGRFPDHNIVAEETGRLDQNSEYTWYVDPMDGTNCFVMGVPYFSVSLGLARGGETVLGVVYNPLQDDLYTAEMGSGAYHGDQRLAVSGRGALPEALVSAGYYGDDSAVQQGMRMIEALSLAARKVVVHFSPALDLCNIARGRMDAYVDRSTTPEDHAAGALLVTEAGGRVQDYGGGPWRVDAPGIVASNGGCQDALFELLTAADKQS